MQHESDMHEREYPKKEHCSTLLALFIGADRIGRRSMNSLPFFILCSLGLLLELFAIFFWKSGCRFSTSHRSFAAKRRKNWEAIGACMAGILFFALAFTFR